MHSGMMGERARGLCDARQGLRFSCSNAIFEVDLLNVMSMLFIFRLFALVAASWAPTLLFAYCALSQTQCVQCACGSIWIWMDFLSVPFYAAAWPKQCSPTLSAQTINMSKAYRRSPRSHRCNYIRSGLLQ